MRRRTISLFLCMMMVVSLFAGCLTSASAAEVPGIVTAAPKEFTIKGTGTASFAASTALNGITDKISSDTGFDVSQLIGALKEGGFQIDQISKMLDDSGMDWSSILTGLQDSGFSVNEIVDMLKGDDSSNGFNFADVINELRDSEQFADLMDLISGDNKTSALDAIADILKDLIKDKDAEATPTPDAGDENGNGSENGGTENGGSENGGTENGGSEYGGSENDANAVTHDVPDENNSENAGGENGNENAGNETTGENGSETETPADDDNASELLESIKKYLKEALKERYGTAFDEAAEAKIDDLFEQLKPVDGKIDMDALVSKLQEALGDDFKVEDVAEAVIKAFGGDPDEQTLEDLVKALVGTANDDEEAQKNLSDMVKAAMENMGQNFDADTVSALIDAIAGSDSKFDAEKLINGLLDGGVKLSDLIAGATNSDSGFDADELLSTLLDRGIELSDLIDAMKANGDDNSAITDLILGGSYTYTWYVRTAKGVEKVELTKDKNTYSGADTKTLTVKRDTAPTETETYTYFCVVAIDALDVQMTSNDVKLTIAPEGAAEPTTPPSTQPTTQPTAEPTAPVLDNETHIAYINGYPDGTVLPENNITRAEVAQIIYKLMTAETKAKYATTVNTFSDVNSGWYNEAVSTLARASVINGYPDGTFKPDQFITRAEVAAILTRVQVLNASLASAPQAAKNFPDVSATHWAYAAIQTASRNGWINGYPEGTFLPDNNIKRCETVAMMNRLLSRNPQSLNDMIITGMNVFRDNADVNAWYFLYIQEAANGHDYSRDASGHEKWTAVKN